MDASCGKLPNEQKQVGEAQGDDRICGLTFARALNDQLVSHVVVADSRGRRVVMCLANGRVGPPDHGQRVVIHRTVQIVSKTGDS